jgi:hypothetical protein
MELLAAGSAPAPQEAMPLRARSEGSAQNSPRCLPVQQDFNSRAECLKRKSGEINLDHSIHSLANERS